MLVANRNKLVFSEEDVTGPAGLKPNDAYDLTLYEDSSDSGKGVLIVHMDLQMRFHDGTDAAGKALPWDEGSKAQFISDYRSAIKSIWNDRWRITTRSTVAAIRDIGVLFEFNFIIRNWFSVSEHWELDITKTDSFQQSWVSPFWGNSAVDSQDTVGVSKGATKSGCSGHGPGCVVLQRGAVHEFGHMLGLRDEYPSAGDNLNWKGDGESIMHSGEIVRPRHYAIFAAWLTEQYAYVSHLAGEKIEFKVDGTWDLANAQL